MRDPHLIESFSHHKIDKFLNALLAGIKSRHRGHDPDAEAREFQHIFKVNGGKRRFARHENKFTAFLDRAIGGPVDQILAEA